MAAEGHALIHAVDMGMVIKKTLSELPGQEVELKAYADSRKLFTMVAKEGNITECQLQIDVFTLKESNQKGELRPIGWTPGKKSAADVIKRDILLKETSMWA